jgi:hypothetical protein
VYFYTIIDSRAGRPAGAAMRDVASSPAEAVAGRNVTAAEMEKIIAARAEGIDFGDDADVVADMHARGLPDAVCMATLDALITVRRQPR